MAGYRFSGRISAPAKINLFLKVLGLREDGYHELETLMVRLDLSDHLVFEEIGRADDCLEVSFGEFFPQPEKFDENFLGKQNLVLRALRAFRDLTGEPQGALSIHMDKNIPLGAGLGGGSSDAAAVLRFLADRCPKVVFSDLQKIALNLGADVPFFLSPEPVKLARGVGEKLSDWTGSLPEPFIVLINPKITLNTARVYASLGLTKQLRSNNLTPVGPGEVSERSAKGFFGYNDLWSGAVKIFSELAEIRLKIEKMAEGDFGLSGSGPTFWAAYRTSGAAFEAMNYFLKEGFWSIVTSLES